MQAFAQKADLTGIETVEGRISSIWGMFIWLLWVVAVNLYDVVQ